MSRRSKEDLEKQLLDGRKHWATLKIDEQSSSVRSDALLQSLVSSRDKAKQYDLFELAPHLDSMILALAGKSKSHIACQRICYTGIDPSTIDGKPLNYAALRDGFNDYATLLSKSFSQEIFHRIPNDMKEEFGKNTMKMLGPESKFDEAHKMQSMQEMMRLSMKSAGMGMDSDPQKSETEFGNNDPVQLYHKDKEAGYAQVSTKINKCHNLSDAKHVYELGRMAWMKKKNWTAEMCWEKASQLDSSQAKYFSNLATARINLGRYLRSLQVGYRSLASTLLKDAVKVAEKGMEVDPSWERSYQRAAEAYLTLGPYEHSLDACRVLKKAMDHISEPSDTLMQLQIKAKTNARHWCSLKVRPGETTIPKILDSSLHNLRCAVMKSFPLCYNYNEHNPPTSTCKEEIAKVGDEIADAIISVKAALQLIFLRRIDWEKQSKEAQVVKINYQIELRKVAKVLPLETVLQSETLKKIVFVEDPFTFWGLDRLDRLRVEYLDMSAEDPCDEEENDFMDESVKRGVPGEGNMSMETMMAAMEAMVGKQATSFDQDMAPHHICAFTMGVLERLILSDRYALMKEAASIRLIDFALSANKNQNALHMGGEFIGKATMEATGREIYTKSRGKDSDQFFHFIKYSGGVTTVCKEIYNSGDPDQVLQRLLCLLTPEDWRKQLPYDIFWSFLTYILPGMEDGITLKISDIKPYVIEIMSNIFDAHPEIMDVLRSGCTTTDNSVLQVLMALYKASFGQYIVRNFFSEEKSLREKGKSYGTKNVVKSLVGKWQTLGTKKKSAYRWECLSAETRKRLSDLEPISRLDKFEKKKKKQAKAAAGASTRRKKKEKDHSFAKKMVVTELAECAKCSQQTGFGVELRQCPCKLVYYCCTDCQKLDWTDHKPAHKRIMGKSSR